MDTQTQIDRLIELAIVQRSDLKKLVSELPQLRDHLNAEIERMFEDAEPQIRAELEDWTTKQAKDETAKLGSQLEAKLISLSKSLEATTQTRYNAIMAERAQNIDLAKKAEDKLAEVAQAIPVQVKQIVTDELARFPRAGEIDQLRKEFAEPRGLNPRGRWQAGETYNKLDLVSYNGDSYVSNTDGNREKPSRSSEAWTLSAARGNGGAGGVISSLTDLVAVPSNGQLLIGNGSAFVNNTITAGTGVTVTNGPGTITIDASVAQEILTATVTNAESFAITRGQVVYLFGATGNRASVKLANNATDAESSKTFGVVSEASIAAGGNGLVTCVGTVDKLTLGSYTEGDVLYLGATPGSMTATKPYAPNHLVYVGIVERANNGNGELYVRIQNGFELDEIHDVQITTPPLAGALLMRDATNSLWKANRLTGTANQVTVTNADTAVTLSLPTSLASVDTITASAATPLTLTGGSTGASLVLGATTSGQVTFTKASGDVQYKATSGTKIAFLGTDSANPYVGALSNDNLDLWAGAANKARLTSTGNLLIGTTTDAANLSGGLIVNGSGTAAAASNTTTGALRVTGGVGVSGAGYFGGVLSAGGAAGTIYSAAAGDAYLYATNTDATATSRAGLQLKTGTSAEVWQLFVRNNNVFLGKSGIADYVQVGPTNFDIKATTSASSSISGALTIGNGTAATNVAIGAGRIYTGSDITAGGAITANNQIITTGASAGFRIDRRDTSVAAWQLYSLAGNLSIYDHTSGGDKVTIAATTGNVALASTAPSTGSTSGALQVAGGIYAGAASVFGGNVNLSASSAITRALSVTNTLGNLDVGVFGSGGVGYVGTTSATNFQIYAHNALSATFGAAGAATFAGAVTANGQLIAKGTATNDNAATGYIGEYVSSTLAQASAVSLTTATTASVTSISLTAGDWDIEGNVAFIPQTTTVRSRAIGCIFNSVGLPASDKYSAVNYGTADATGANIFTVRPVATRYSLSATTTIYLTTYADFSAGTLSAFGFIAARRVR